MPHDKHRAPGRPAPAWFHNDLVSTYPNLIKYAGKLSRKNRAYRDDLVQETLERCLERWEQFQRGTSIVGWVLSICHSRHCDNVRRLVRHGEIFIYSDDNSFFDSHAVPAAQQDAMKLADVEAAIARLTPEYREALELAAMELSYGEMAAIMGVPVGTVRSRLWRGREELYQHCRKVGIVAGPKVRPKIRDIGSTLTADRAAA